MTKMINRLKQFLSIALNSTPASLMEQIQESSVRTIRMRRQRSGSDSQAEGSVRIHTAFRVDESSPRPMSHSVVKRQVKAETRKIMNDRIPGSSWSNPIRYEGFEIGPSEDDDPRNPRPFAAVRIQKPQVEYEAHSVEQLKRDIDKHWRLIRESNVAHEPPPSTVSAPVSVPVDSLPNRFATDGDADARMKDSPLERWEKKLQHKMVRYIGRNQFFEGIVTSVFLKLDGRSIRCNVESESGTVHILNPDNLEVLEEKYKRDFYGRRAAIMEMIELYNTGVRF